MIGLWFLRDKIIQVDRKHETLSAETAHRLLHCARANEEVFEDYVAEIQRIVVSNFAASSIISPLLKGSEKNRQKLLSQSRPAETNKMTNQLEMANSLAGVMEEHGYSCSTSQAVFRAVIAQFGAIDESAVARVVGMMARTHAGLDDSGMMPSLTAVLGDTGESENGNESKFKLLMRTSVYQAFQQLSHGFNPATMKMLSHSLIKLYKFLQIHAPMSKENDLKSHQYVLNSCWSLSSIALVNILVHDRAIKSYSLSGLRLYCNNFYVSR